jgi:hypothetical protein
VYRISKRALCHKVEPGSVDGLTSYATNWKIMNSSPVKVTEFFFLSFYQNLPSATSNRNQYQKILGVGLKSGRCVRLIT